VEASRALLYGCGVAKDEAGGLRWLRTAADAGDARAQLNLYVCHQDGLGGLRPDDPAAVTLLRASAEGGFVHAQTELSQRLREGKGMPVDAAGANSWGLRAAEGGHAGAQSDMGLRLLFGMGIPTDTVAGVALLRKAVDAGDLIACLFLGDAHATGLGGLRVDAVAARSLYEPAAAGGNAAVAADARSRLHTLTPSHALSWLTALPTEIRPVCGHAGCGAALDAGTLSGLCGGCRSVRYCPTGCQRAAWPEHRAACKAAVARRAAALGDTSSSPTSSSSAPPTGGAAAATLKAHREEMEVWRRMPLDALRAAAEGGVAAAQGTLGVAYLDGTLGVGADDDTGRGWLRKAAAQGLLPVRARLGETAFVEARVAGADADALYGEAQDWFQPMAEAGDAGAQHNMFVCCYTLAKRRGGAEAVRWLRAAAAQQQALALNMLGVYAWDRNAALGVARDRAEAARLFAAADAAGFPAATRAARPAGAPGSAAPG
jgi:TPR repeat protein